MDNNLGNLLLIAFGLLCVLPVVLVLVAGVVLYRMGRQRLEGFIEPDLDKMQAHYETLRAQNPAANRETLVNRIIHQQALKCGIIGAVTGIGGFYTLPIALPIDLVLSLRIQAALVSFIAHAYGAGDNAREANLRNYIIMTGSSEATQTTTRVFTRFLLRVIGKSFSKLIPFLSALISFGVNYALVQVMARVAVRWYSRAETLPPPPSQPALR